MSKGNLKDILEFPIIGYDKLNGFLGLVSYNHLTDDFYICSKSSSKGDYAGYLRKLFYKKFDNDKRSFLLDYLKSHDVSLSFEVIDIDNDPHIISYRESDIILLSIIRNDIHFSEYDYEEVVNLGSILGLNYTKPLITLNNFNDFVNYYNDVILKEDIYDVTNSHIEGLVFKDKNNFIFKVKFPYYNYWKGMRGLITKYLSALSLNNDIEIETLLSSLSEIDKNILLLMAKCHLNNNMDNVNILTYLDDIELLNYLSSLSNNSNLI